MIKIRLFRYRLKLALRFAGIITAATSMIMLFFLGVVWMQESFRLSEQALKIISWLLVIVVIVCLLMLVYTILKGLYLFISWLIIEPYREWKKQQS